MSNIIVNSTGLAKPKGTIQLYSEGFEFPYYAEDQEMRIQNCMVQPVSTVTQTPMGAPFFPPNPVVELIVCEFKEALDDVGESIDATGSEISEVRKENADLRRVVRELEKDVQSFRSELQKLKDGQ